jgi:hypothetical protein
LCSSNNAGSLDLDSVRDIYIGVYGSNYFDGRMDEIKIWNYALSEEEIQEEYDNFIFPIELVAHYSFDYDVGNIVSDVSGKGNDGSTRGAPQYISGKSGKAMKFDGVDDFVKILDSETLSNRESITMGLWVKTDDVNSPMMIHKYDGTSPHPGYALRKYGTGTRFWAGNTGGDGWLTCTESIQDNQWHHVITTAENNGLKEIYVDGQLCSSNNAGSLDLDSQSPMYIGARGSTLFNGYLDEIKIWDQVMTQEEIEEEYESYILPKELVAHYSFDSDVGGVMSDQSGYGNHGGFRGDAHRFNGELVFDGIGDYAVVANSDSLSNMESVTIGVWIKTMGISNPMIVYKHDGSAFPYPGYSLRKYGTGISFWAGATGGDGWLRCTQNIQDGEWHYVVASAGDNGLKKTYVDGMLCSSNNAGSLDLNNLRNIYIGAYGGEFFYGNMDEIKIWNYELNENEVLSEYYRSLKIDVDVFAATKKDVYATGEKIELTEVRE